MMKVLDLCCAQGHVFEGWFASEADFLSQQERLLVACPVCADVHVVRRPSAPRLNLTTLRGDSQNTSSETKTSFAPLQGGQSGSITHGASVPVPARQSSEPSGLSSELAGAVQAALIQAVREVFSKTDDVGDRFAEEARRIHYGETEARGIRGRATSAQRAELHEEGIEVFTLPVPDALNKPTH